MRADQFVENSELREELLAIVYRITEPWNGPNVYGV